MAWEETLWKGNVIMKLEEDHKGAKSIAHWFGEINLTSLYERNKMHTKRASVQTLEFQYELCDRKKLFDDNFSVNRALAHIKQHSHAIVANNILM